MYLPGKRQIGDFFFPPIQGPPTENVYRWWKNGDHPLDYPAGGSAAKEADWEGEVVRRYRHPDVRGTVTCPECRASMHRHGWIDTETPSGGYVVCPGDWIIYDEVQKTYYTCSPRLFAMRYPGRG